MVTTARLWAHEITLAPREQSVASARRFVRDRLDLHHLQALVDDVVLVTSELATNAVRHAGTAFSVTISSVGDGVVLAVRDGSRVRPVLVDAGVDDTSGRGLSIVGLVSREWGVLLEAGGKSVWAAFGVG